MFSDVDDVVRHVGKSGLDILCGPEPEHLGNNVPRIHSKTPQNNHYACERIVPVTIVKSRVGPMPNAALLRPPADMRYRSVRLIPATSNKSYTEQRHGSRHQGQDGDRLRSLEGPRQGHCAWRWRRRASTSSSPRAPSPSIEATAEEIRKATGVKVTAITGDVTTEEGRKAAARRLPEPRHPHQQRRRPAPRRLQGLLARRLAQGGRVEHDHADRADQSHRLRHDGPRLRPHRQHHPPVGEGADRLARTLERRPRRPHRRRRRHGAQGRRATTSRSTTSCPAPSRPTA